MQPLVFNKDHFGQVAERLMIRLDLANFKCKHGYQNMDLYSIEAILRQYATTTMSTKKGTGRLRDNGQKGQHRHYYPIHHHKKQKKQPSY
ncbi:hypothetical protein BC941DRAFT_415663, partial [Chlamydoabsidia padenii]